MLDRKGRVGISSGHCVPCVLTVSLSARDLKCVSVSISLVLASTWTNEWRNDRRSAPSSSSCKREDRKSLPAWSLDTVLYYCITVLDLERLVWLQRLSCMLSSIRPHPALRVLELLLHIAEVLVHDADAVGIL